MDPIKILKRAWAILWSYRALWIFGFILALTTATGGGSNSGSSSRFTNNNAPSGQNSLPNIEQIPSFFRPLIQSLQRPPMNDVNFWIGIGIVVLVIVLILVIVFAFLRYIAETALIRMVDQFEKSGEKTSIRQGFRFGWSRTSWKLFLINLTINIPNIVAVAFLLGLGLVVFALFSSGLSFLSIASGVGLIGVIFLVIFILILINASLNLLQHFFWRICVLEGAGVIESIRLGFVFVKRNWRNAGVMWLLMIGLGIAWGIASIIAFILLIPMFILFGVVGLVVAGIPAAAVFGVTSLFLSAPITWIIAALAGLPILMFVISLPMVCVMGLKEVYRSTVWTLTYRELVALENVVINLPGASEV